MKRHKRPRNRLKRNRRFARNETRRYQWSRLVLEQLEARHLLANFSPASVPALIQAIDTANGNNQADVIDLGGNVFTLTGDHMGTGNGLPVIAADGGNALTIENGIIERNTTVPTARKEIFTSTPSPSCRMEISKVPPPRS